jgi:zinc transporter ZupT
LRQHHRKAYRRVGRWLLAVAVLLGWAVGGIELLPVAVEGLLLAVLAGALLLVALKEELPAQGRHLGWFAGGVLVCALLLAAL